ncbi:MAG: UxaA family hydrolase [Anaerolineales bacterium]|nr:UxaA family hydrolase [Anaerolineales bacterium]
MYNIILKSIGAALKKHPDTRLDYAIDYSARMAEPGFYFMDSPGLDLESVAGQVASGCNVIYFTTGNGSVTNFPFVPTIKVVTTTALRVAL